MASTAFVSVSLFAILCVMTSPAQVNAWHSSRGWGRDYKTCSARCVVDLKSEVECAAQTIGALEQVNEALNNRMTNMESQVSLLKAEIEADTERMENMNGTIAALEERLAALEEVPTGSADWLMTQCSDDSDCPSGINAQCFQATCLCTPGYYYSNSQNICLEDCPEADLQHDEFLLYPDAVITSTTGTKIFETHFSHQKDCLDRCSKDETCRTYELQDNGEGIPESCILRSDIVLPVTLVSASRNIFSQKRCA